MWRSLGWKNGTPGHSVWLWSGWGSRRPSAPLYEDSPAACAAAKAAGLTVVAVYDPFYASYEQQLRRSCDGYLKSFTELLG